MNISQLSIRSRSSPCCIVIFSLISSRFSISSIVLSSSFALSRLFKLSSNKANCCLHLEISIRFPRRTSLSPNSLLSINVPWRRFQRVRNLPREVPRKDMVSIFHLYPSPLTLFWIISCENTIRIH